MTVCQNRSGIINFAVVDLTEVCAAQAVNIAWETVVLLSRVSPRFSLRP